MNSKYQVANGDTLWGLAERFYGDGRRYRVISAINGLVDPDDIVVGQELEIPYVTFRHQVTAGDTTRRLAERYYQDAQKSGIVEVANHAGQRDLVVGEWLLIPDLEEVGHHTVAAGETLIGLAARWYGESAQWPVIAIANDVETTLTIGQVLVRPRMNRRRTIASGDTLWQLTNDTYGDAGATRTSTLVMTVAAANLIEHPGHIGVGQVLFFPSFELGG